MNLKNFIAITKALSDPQRVRALMALQQGELCVCRIIELLKLAPSTVSKHISILKQAGIVNCRKNGRWVYYSIDDQINEDIAGIIRLTVEQLKNDLTIQIDSSRLTEITTMDTGYVCKSETCGGKLQDSARNIEKLK